MEAMLLPRSVRVLGLTAPTRRPPSVRQIGRGAGVARAELLALVQRLDAVVDAMVADVERKRS
ncbi:hypothetical protein I4I84_01180 [Pseudonocardia sp. KRD-182]|uniref:hypothetical protein n=1 Tax=Pseudonocardia oceani TaxID=2792013 RepID=UPI001C4A53F4|nr:hypothetical protein [Pseudonocardia oceani]MBW0107363.1 hypothetical protein [Pseudonocardia oceani]MBW0122460.1 hypothetical protein [Pseudonocardia oceani]